MNVIKHFNGLNGADISRTEILRIIDLAKKQEQNQLVERLEAVLKQYDDEKFTFEIDDPAFEVAPESLLHCIDCEENESNAVGLSKPVSPNDIYDMVTDLMINTIKEVGHLPWQQEWKGSGGFEAKNYVTKKPYSGINFFLLNFDFKKDKNGKKYLVPIEFIQPYYLTFNQIEAAGATLKKGSKGHEVVYYTIIRSFKKDDKEITTSDTKKFNDFVKSNGLTKEDLEKVKKYPILKYYNVFRADDCVGLKFPPTPKQKEVNPIDAAQNIIDGYKNPPKYTFVGDGAFYVPATDVLNMPKIQAFDNEASYYCTFFHEITHSTGAAKRLARDFSGKKGGTEYAFEELIAELGAVYMCSESGILFHTRENSAKYLRGWNSRLVKELEDDNKFFLKAAAAAQKATNYVLNVDAKNQKKTKEIAKKSTIKPKKAVKPVVKPKVKVQQKTKKPIVVVEERETPLMKQYNAIKAKYPDAILLFRVGDFYEIFNKDAVIASKILGITLTKRNQTSNKIIELAGFPHYSLEQYLPKLVKAGHRVAVCDQLESSDKKRTDLKRDLGKTKVYTKEDLERINPKPYSKKPKSTSVANAISDILKMGKYSDIKPMQANVLFQVLKNIDNEFESVVVEDKFKISIIDKINPKYIAVFEGEWFGLKDGYYTSVIEVTKFGFEFIQSIKNRLESVNNQKNNYSFFDGLNAPKKKKTVVKKLNAPIPATTPEPTPVNNNLLVKSSKDLMAMSFDSLKFTGLWNKFMQEPARNMKIAGWGAPKNGKTTGFCQLANYLTQFGNVLYNFADQGFNKSTQDIWKLTGLENNPRAFSTAVRELDDLDKLAASGDYQFIFIDMISTYIQRTGLKPHEFDDRFVKKYPNISFILIFEVTKGGNFKGDQGWTHIVDAMVTVEDYVMTNRGRYGTGDYVVWKDGLQKFNPKKFAELYESEPNEEIKETQSTGFSFSIIEN